MSEKVAVRLAKINQIAVLARDATGNFRSHNRSSTLGTASSAARVVRSPLLVAGDMDVFGVGLRPLVWQQRAN
jgi:hypothetical protein